MNRRRTKRRKSKRFEWKETETTVVMVVTGNIWYLKSVECKQLGEWAYHWMYKGWFSIFYVPSGCLVGHVHTEKQARSIVKKLHLKVHWPQPTNIHSWAAVDWFVAFKSILGTMPEISHNLPEEVAYNPDEDIPF